MRHLLSAAQRVLTPPGHALVRRRAFGSILLQSFFAERPGDAHTAHAPLSGQGQIARMPELRVFHHATNRGKGAAVRTAALSVAYIALIVIVLRPLARPERVVLSMLAVAISATV